MVRGQSDRTTACHPEAAMAHIDYSRWNSDPERTALAEDRIRFLEGRPDRDRAIQADDITNLTIALNTARTLAEFLDLV